MRLPAAFVAGLLLLTGAGEVLGACHCAHRGGQHSGVHGLQEQAVPAAAGEVDEHHTGNPSHAAPHAHAGAEPQDERGAEDPASNACRALCALACGGNPDPVPGVTEGTPDLATAVPAAPAPAVEPKDLVPPTARPHVLPLSQAPPTKA